MTTAESAQALPGLRSPDLSRIVAGPIATHLLADRGDEVITIERPGTGDDTRGWGTSFHRDATGAGSGASACFLAADRGEHSVAVNIADPQGQTLLQLLAKTSDVLIENFKPGDRARVGRDHAALNPSNPRLIYSSITGFGQSGQNAHRAGCDFLVQPDGGLMSLTGTPDGPPMKAGVGVADLPCGICAVAGILGGKLGE